MQSSIKRNHLRNVLEYILAIFSVYANGSWLTFEYLGPVKVVLYLLLFLYLIYNLLEKKSISVPDSLVLFLALFPLISKLINFERDSDLLNTFSVMLMYLLLGFYSKETLFSILDKYARVIFVLCIISIFLGVIFWINYAWLGFFPISYNELFFNSSGYYNLIVYTDRVVQDFRVQGIFWEPGAWAYNQIFAFYWYLFVRRDSSSLFVFIIGLLLTASTTGFIMILLIGIQILFFEKDKITKKHFSLIITLSIGLLVLVAIIVKSNYNIDIGQIIYEQTIDKIFNSDSKLAAESSDVRKETTLEALKITLENPIFGIGRQKAGSILFVTSSIAELAYQLGIPYLLIFIYAFRSAFDRLNFLISIPFIIIFMNGEAYSSYILSSMIVIYGAKDSMVAKFLSYFKNKQLKLAAGK